MTEHRTMRVDFCQGCHRARFEPGQARIAAFMQIDVTGFHAPGGGREYMDGLGVYFHAGCFLPGDPRYRRAES